MLLTATPLIAMAAIACWHHAKLRFDQNDYRPRFPLLGPHADSNLAPVTADRASPRLGAVAGVFSDHRFHGEV